MENRKIVLPENVKKIIETLQTHGYEAVSYTHLPHSFCIFG